MKNEFLSRNIQVIIVDPSASLTHPESIAHSDVSFTDSLDKIPETVKNGVIIFDVFTDSHNPATLSITKSLIQKIKGHFKGFLVGMGRYDGRALPDAELGGLMKDIHGYIGTEYFQSDMNNLLGGMQMAHEIIINNKETLQVSKEDKLRDVILRINYLFLQRYFNSFEEKSKKADIFIDTHGGFEILPPGTKIEALNNRSGILTTVENTEVKKTKYHYKPLPKEFEFADILQHSNN